MGIRLPTDGLITVVYGISKKWMPELFLVPAFVFTAAFTYFCIHKTSYKSKVNSISQHICYLLRHHDCVVLPGWGAFVAQRCPAVIDVESDTIYPPRRVLGFNAAITHDDGLIASSVVRREGISYEAALQRVSEVVDTLRRQIAVDRECHIAGIGSFHMTDDDVCVFEPSDSNIVALPSSVLPVVSVRPVLEVAKTQAEERDMLPAAGSRPFSRNWMKIAASLVALICLGIVFSTPIAIPDAARASLAAPAITFASQDDDAVYELSDANRHGVLSIVIPQEADAMAVVDTAKVDAPIVAIPSIGTGMRMAESDSYCVIVASLASRELAQDFVDNADIPMSILERDGKYRVYAATGSTLAGAMDIARQTRLTDRYPGVWVCRR